MLPAALPSRPRATLASPEPGGWPKKTWSARAPPLGPALSSGLSLSASFAWLIFLPRLFVSVCPLFAIPGPHSRLEATRSWPVSENGRWEGRVCSLYFFSVGNSRSLFSQLTPSAPLSEKTVSAAGMHRSGPGEVACGAPQGGLSECWARPRRHGRRSRSQQPLSGPWPSPGSQTVQGVSRCAGSNGGATRRGSGGGAAQCLRAVLAVGQDVLGGQSAGGTSDSEGDVLVIYPTCAIRIVLFPLALWLV